MSKAKAGGRGGGESAAQQQGAVELGTAAEEKRGLGRPRINGENIFACQSKIYAYMSPNKSPALRPPLQEENSTAHHVAKSHGKVASEICSREEDSINTGGTTEGVMKSEGQNEKETRCEFPGSFPNKKPEATETPKPLSPESSEAANKTGAQKMGTESKPGPKRKVQGKVQQNRKVTDYFPVRRSSRKSKKELQIEEKKRIDELIESGKEDGMKIDLIDGKGRGVIATRHFKRGEFVVEYHGDLIEITDAKKREAIYAQDPATGCYMYYFQYLRKTYCVDATKETHRLGRLINHSKCGNCQTKLHAMDGVPHLILVASRDIKAGEELLYDYGDRSKASLEAHPWLKH